MPFLRSLWMVEMQLTAHALPEPEVDGAGSDPPDRPKPPGVAEYDARRCVACGCNYPAYGFGPPLHASTTIWACASHRLEVLRQVRASGTFHVDRVGRAVDDDRPDLGGRTARVAQRSLL